MVNWQEFTTSLGAYNLKENEPLASHVSVSTDAVAKLYCEVEKTPELMHLVKQARKHGIPFYMIGAGTFARFSIETINGLIIKNNCRKFEAFAQAPKDDKIYAATKVYAEAGVNLNQLVRFTVERGLGGIEYFLGLPGTLGGAIFTNARFTPKSIYLNDIVESVKILTPETVTKEISAQEFTASSTVDLVPSNTVIISATFNLFPGDKNELWDRANKAAEYRTKLSERKPH